MNTLPLSVCAAARGRRPRGFTLMFTILLLAFFGAFAALVAQAIIRQASHTQHTLVRDQLDAINVSELFFLRQLLHEAQPLIDGVTALPLPKALEQNGYTALLTLKRQTNGHWRALLAANWQVAGASRLRLVQTLALQRLPSKQWRITDDH